MKFGTNDVVLGFATLADNPNWALKCDAAIQMADGEFAMTWNGKKIFIAPSRLRTLTWGALSTCVAVMQPLTHAAAQDPVITPMGVFTSCVEALQYRNGPLAGKFGEEFVRMASGVQERVDKVAKEFEGHRAEAKKALNEAKGGQIK